jgi:hypothetical protein
MYDIELLLSRINNLSVGCLIVNLAAVDNVMVVVADVDRVTSGNNHWHSLLDMVNT